MHGRERQFERVTKGERRSVHVQETMRCGVTGARTNISSAEEEEEEEEVEGRRRASWG